MADKTHWENIFSTKTDDQVSWFQPHLHTSLRLIDQTGIGTASQVIDVGGGTSTLVDDLLARGFQPTVLDLAAAALNKSRQRLGTLADQVTWIEGDVTTVPLPPLSFDLWHDRAVFHFLTHAEDRRNYVAQVIDALKPNGHLIVATFALDGPERCSNLDVVRYSASSLQSEFGDSFVLRESLREEHQTPFGTQQAFVYCHFQKHPF